MDFDSGAIAPRSTLSSGTGEPRPDAPATKSNAATSTASALFSPGAYAPGATAGSPADLAEANPYLQGTVEAQDATSADVASAIPPAEARPKAPNSQRSASTTKRAKAKPATTAATTPRSKAATKVRSAQASQALEGELVPADSAGTTQLPGEKAVDEALLDQAVVHLNAIYITKGQELYEALATYLVETFFQGHLELFTAREKHHVTWRALSKRPDLRFSHSTLWYALAIRQQALELPEDVVRGLSVTHQRHLTHVRDAEQKLELAGRAMDEGLSERDLRQVIRGVKRSTPQGKLRGRPLKANFQSQIAELRRTLRGGGQFLLLMGRLTGEEAAEVLAEIETVAAQLELICNQLEAASR